MLFFSTDTDERGLSQTAKLKLFGKIVNGF